MAAVSYQEEKNTTIDVFASSHSICFVGQTHYDNDQSINTPAKICIYSLMSTVSESTSSMVLYLATVRLNNK